MEEYQRHQAQMGMAQQLIGYLNVMGEEEAAEMVEKYAENNIGSTRPDPSNQ